MDRTKHGMTAKKRRPNAADIVAMVTAIPDIARFNNLFVSQFLQEPFLGIHVLRVLLDFFREVTSPACSSTRNT